jgi:hypothetical protein
MSVHTPEPRWWQLYALIPAVVALFVMESELSVSQTTHRWFQAGLVVVVFVLVQWWLSANRHELMQAERRRTHRPDSRIPFPARRLVTERHDVEEPVAPMFHLPPGGLRNTLEDTFELDLPDSDPANRRPR